VSRLQDFLNTDKGLRTALWLGKMVPPGLASAGIAGIAGLSARRKRSRMVSAVKSNLAVVLNTSEDDPALTRHVAKALYYAGMASFEFFHKVAHGREALGELVPLPPDLLEMFEKQKAAGRGMVAVSAHMGALDLAGVAFTVTDFEVQVISYAAPPAGYRLVNELRSGHGLVITPGSKQALAAATARLESAGIVFTALDRPVPPGRRASDVVFFNRPTRLWNGYTKMAFATGALLFFVWVVRTPQGRYEIRFNEPIDCADPPGDIDYVTSLMLQQAEDAIRDNPDQWLMFFPLWPKKAQVEGEYTGERDSGAKP
jgi:lauroyl/myristoyl acyltransferase